MRKISANYIYPVTSNPIKNGILVLDDDNRIVDVIDTQGKIKEIQNLEFYSGIITPGFIDVFTLLSWSSFNKEDITECFAADFTTILKEKMNGLSTDPHSIQRGINHLEAFGTKGAADFLPDQQGKESKQRSKVLFRDVNFTNFSLNLQIPGTRESNFSNDPILLNRISIKNLNQPDPNNFKRYCVGSGSLATHQKLSVFEELKQIQTKFLNQSVWELIKWASINPATYLALCDDLGSLEIVKKPGLNLLSKIDLQNQRLASDSELRVLI